jgi:hypothetical protein
MRSIAIVIAAAAVVGTAAAQPSAEQSTKPPAGVDPPTVTGQTDGRRQAPIGHRQPKAKDLPPGVGQGAGMRSPEDEAVDRKLRICRDC